jgi:hypothetical protein
LGKAGTVCRTEIHKQTNSVCFLNYFLADFVHEESDSGAAAAKEKPEPQVRATPAHRQAINPATNHMRSPAHQLQLRLWKVLGKKAKIIVINMRLFCFIHDVTQKRNPRLPSGLSRLASGRHLLLPYLLINASN